jgi:thiol-disulfide isomerase/thioredoxin
MTGGGPAPSAGDGSSDPVAPRKSRRRTIFIAGPIVLVVIVVVVFIVVSATSDSSSTSPPPPPPAHETSSLVAKVTSVPESVFVKVGLPSEITNTPTKVTKHAALEHNGLPVVVYVGAEYCPFCAAERWAIIMALSKFGTFSGLTPIFSSSSDYAPNTPTFTFYKSSYKSKYLVFEPYEVATNKPAASTAACNVDGYTCLQTKLPATVYNLFEGLGGGSFPFIDFGNYAMQSGAGFEDQPLLLAGFTQSQVATQLYNPNSAVAQAEDGSANYLTAAVCAMTGNKPVAVCSVPYVKKAQGQAGLQPTG